MSLYSATEAATEEAAQPVALNIGKITILQLYVFLLKLMVAGAMATAPIVLIIWFVNYATSH